MNSVGIRICMFAASRGEQLTYLLRSRSARAVQPLPETVVRPWNKICVFPSNHISVVPRLTKMDKVHTSKAAAVSAVLRSCIRILALFQQYLRCTLLHLCFADFVVLPQRFDASLCGVDTLRHRYLFFVLHFLFGGQKCFSLLCHRSHGVHYRRLCVVVLHH